MQVQHVAVVHGRLSGQLGVELQEAVRGAVAAWACAVLHGLTFVWQAALVALAKAPPALTLPGATFDRAVNFAIRESRCIVSYRIVARTHPSFWEEYYVISTPVNCNSLHGLT